MRDNRGMVEMPLPLAPQRWATLSSASPCIPRPCVACHRCVCSVRAVCELFPPV